MNIIARTLTRTATIVVAGVLLFGCQFPLSRVSGARQVVLNLSYSQPSETRSLSRLLLPSATSVTLVVTENGTEVSKAAYPINGTSASAVLLLEPLKTYQLEAWAYDSSTPPVLQFHGTGSVLLKTDNQKAQLLLLPVAGGALTTPWPVVLAADQPPNVAGVGALAGLMPKSSTTQIFDFGATSSAFTWATDTTGAVLYLQNEAGVAITPQTKGAIVPADLGTGTRFWATWYLPEGVAGPVGLSPLGKFSIPVTSLSLSGPTSLLQRASAPAAFALAPTNATNQAASDLEWASDAPGVVSVDAAGQLTAIGKGSARVTVSLKANPAVSSALTITVTGGTKPGLKLWNSGPWVYGPAALPGTIALTGTSKGLTALTSNGEVWTSATSGGEWSLRSPDSPTGAQWIAEQGGLLTAATTTTVYQRESSGQWTVLMPGPTVGIQGFCSFGGGWTVAGVDGNLYSWVNNSWEKGTSLPPPFHHLTASPTDLIATDGESFFVLDNGLWMEGGALPLDTEALGFAWDTAVAFVMEQ